MRFKTICAWADVGLALYRHANIDPVIVQPLAYVYVIAPRPLLLFNNTN